MLPETVVPASQEPLPALAYTAIDNADYETMLSRLDRPMADLFNLKVQTNRFNVTVNRRKDEF